MTPEELHDLSTLPNFPATAAELVRIVGTVAAAALITAWPGQEFPVPICHRESERSQRRFDQLAEIIGEIEANHIVEHWGGQKLPVPNCKAAMSSRRQERIRNEYDRLTAKGRCSHADAIFDIGRAHDLTGRAVEIILKRSA